MDLCFREQLAAEQKGSDLTCLRLAGKRGQLPGSCRIESRRQLDYCLPSGPVSPPYSSHLVFGSRRNEGVARAPGVVDLLHRVAEYEKSLSLSSLDREAFQKQGLRFPDLHLSSEGGSCEGQANQLLSASFSSPSL